MEKFFFTLPGCLRDVVGTRSRPGLGLHLGWSFKEGEERAQGKDDTLSATVSLLPTGDSQSLLGVEMGKATSNVSRKTKEETEAVDQSALDSKPTNP